MYFHAFQSIFIRSLHFILIYQFANIISTFSTFLVSFFSLRLFNYCVFAEITYRRSLIYFIMPFQVLNALPPYADVIKMFIQISIFKEIENENSKLLGKLPNKFLNKQCNHRNRQESLRFTYNYHTLCSSIKNNSHYTHHFTLTKYFAIITIHMSQLMEYFCC